MRFKKDELIEVLGRGAGVWLDGGRKEEKGREYCREYSGE